MDKRKRTIRKLMPVSPYDSANLEAWFSDMAGQGLFVVKTGYYFANFDRREPESLIYKLEPCDQYRAKHKKEMEGKYLLAGWEAVGDVWHKFYIFSTGKEDTLKPELSAEIRNAGESFLKKTGHGSLLTCAVDVMLAAFWCYTILGRFGFWYTVTQATPFLLCVLMAFMLGINILWRMSDYIQIRRYLKGRKAGNGEKYAGRWRAKSIRFAIVFLCFCLALIWAGERKSWHKELNALSTDLPVPPISAFSAPIHPVGGSVSFHSSILAPVQFQIIQEGGDAQMLRMDYMELCFPSLVKPVFKSMMWDQLKQSSADPVKVSSGLFDTAYVARISDSMHYIFVTDGLKVVSVCYIGPGYTEEFFNTIHNAMEEWTQPELFQR